jgi:predicted RecA/RadA family phage recombinase
MAKDRKYPQTAQTWPNVKVIAQTAARTSNHALSGDPVICGTKPGVASADADSAGRCVMFIDGIFEVLVSGVDSSGASAADANVAVNGGDKVYFDQSKTPPLSKRAGGVLWGTVVGDHAVQQVAAGATTTKVLVEVGR